MSELRPCPFCSGEAAFDFDDSGYEWIYCKKCGINTDTEVSTYCCAKEKLAKTWNSRSHENKIKADTVKEVMLNCEAFWSDNLGTDVFKVSDIDDCIEKFEKGDIA